LFSVYKSLGLLKHDSGDAAASIPYLEKALTIAHAIGKHTRVVEVMNAIAISYDSLNDFERAYHYYREALTLAEEMSNRRWQAYLHDDMGNCYYLREDYEAARDHLETALTLYLDARNDHWVCVARARLVFTYTALDMPEKARDCLQESILIARRLGSERLWAMVITAAVKFLVGISSEPDMIQTATQWAGFVYQMPQAEHNTLMALDKARAQIIARIGQDAAEQYLSQGTRLHLDDLNGQLTDTFASADRQTESALS